MLVLACILFFWLLLMSTRMPILAILSGGFITLFIFTKFKTKTYVIILGASIFVALGSYLSFTTVKLRVDEVFRTKFALPSSGNDIETYNSTNVRNGVYFCSLKIIKENALLGVGLGDAQDKLNDCYRDELGAKIYGWTTYNTHSQYLFFLLTAGLLGLLLFLTSLSIQLKISVERKENQHFYFLIIVAIICLTENVLVRSDGLIFFSFFNSLFLFNPKKLVDDCN
ncbi:O-antigen ligase family protein [Flagellimonas aquimarina]|nr:O-antigen ligase family protein [Allomuricauda koreensis]